MPPSMDARCRTQYSISLIKLVAGAGLTLAFLGISGCLALRPTPRTSAPEFRGAAAQSATQPPVILPPPPPRMDSLSAEESPLHRLARQASESEKKLGSYLVRIRRRETVNGEDHPLEYILCKYQRAPLSVHLKWLGAEAKGREIVYVQGRYEDKIHLLTGQGDMLGPGRRLSFPPDSPVVRSRCRYPIGEASLGACATRFARLVDSVERGQTGAGSVKYLGAQNRPEFPQPLEAVEHAIPPGQESGLAMGGIRFYYFDETLGLPILIVTFDHNRHQVEYYCFDRLQNPVPFDESDFNPAKLWPKR